MWVIDITHSKDAMKSEFHDRNFRFLSRLLNQIPKILIRLNLKLNFRSNDVHIIHVLSLESKILQMF